MGARTLLLSGADLNLTILAPELSHLSAEASRIIDPLRAADGIILGSPSYHGSISGLMKNVLDYAEDLRTDTRPYFSGRAVGCIATGGGWPGAVHTLGTLRDIVHALRGWPTPLGLAINTNEPVFNGQGDCTDAKIAAALETIAAEVFLLATLKDAA